MMKTGIEHKVRGEYCISLRDADGNETFNSGYRKNLILDSFFLFTTRRDNWQNSTCYICVGTGTTPPAVTQTALVNQVASDSASNSYAQSVVDGVWQVSNTMTSTFNLGAVVGNLSEIGLKIPWANSFAPGNTVQTRALITDAGGLPTTITVTASDQLVVQYRLIISGVDQDYTGTVDINGTTHTWTARRAPGALSFTNLISGFYHQFGCYNGALNGHGVTPSMSSGSVSATDTTGALQPTSTPGLQIVRFTAGINAGNVPGGITAFSSAPYGFYKFGFSPAIPKDNTKVFSFTFEHSLVRG